MKKLLTMIGAAAVAVGANADMWTDLDTGIEWTYSINNADNKTITLGGGKSSTTAMPKATVLDAANIPWTMDINNNGEPYTVTALAAYAFGDCTSLTGSLTIPDVVTSMGDHAFNNTRLDRVASLGGVTAIKGYTFEKASTLTTAMPDLSRVTSYGKGAFYGAKFSGVARIAENATFEGWKAFYGCSNLDVIFAPGPATGTSNINIQEIARSATSLKIFYMGKNTKPTSGDGTMLSGVTGCKVFVPANGYWDGLVTGGTDNDVIYYGASTNLNLSVDEDAGVVTATPTDETALVDVLESAPLFKTYLGWNTRVNITNTIEVASGTITAAMLNAVEFNTMLLTFKVNTQAQLDSVLAAVPASTYPLLAIDASDAKQELILPQGREIYVRVSGDGKQGRYTPKIKGLIISFY